MNQSDLWNLYIYIYEICHWYPSSKKKSWIRHWVRQCLRYFAQTKYDSVLCCLLLVSFLSDSTIYTANYNSTLMVIYCICLRMYRATLLIVVFCQLEISTILRTCCVFLTIYKVQTLIGIINLKLYQSS